MDLFACVSATKALWRLPPRAKTWQDQRLHGPVAAIHQCLYDGTLPIDEGVYIEEDEKEAGSQDFLDEESEWALQRQGPEIARNKLDVMTSRGRHPLTSKEWDDFVVQWSAHFERLAPYEFKGEKHYVFMLDSHSDY